MIIDAPPSDWKRPKIPAATVVALLKAWIRKRFGVVVEIDHRPPLFERRFDTEAWDTVPSANDIAGLEVNTVEEHDHRTNGPGGERRITTAGSDSNRRAKTRAITEREGLFRRRLLAKTTGEPGPEPEHRSRWPRGRKIPSRPFGRRT